MNLYNLKIFADAARMGSMTKAAELNRLSRPAVSQAIKKLEQELDVELLVHQRRAVELTAAGRVLMKRSEDLLEQAKKLADQVRGNRSVLPAEFKFGSSRTLATFNLPRALLHLREEFPEVDLKVHLANSSGLMSKLDNREVDLVLMIGDETLEGAKHVVVGKGHYVLVRPQSKSEASLSYAISERRPETERARMLFERQFGRPLPVLAEIQSWDAIWHSVSEGLCGGLVPDFLLASKSGKVSVVIPKVAPYEIKLVYHATKAQDPMVKALVQWFKGFP